MLSEETTQLLTAYVDGELSPRQREAVLRLLNQSSEARDLLRQLQENAEKVKQLPRRRLDVGFAGDVVKAIAERSVLVDPPRGVALRLRWVPYAAAAAAAVVLFVASLGVAIYFALGDEEGGPGGLLNPNNIAELPAKAAPRPNPIERDPPQPPRKANPLIGQLVDGAYQFYAAPIPPERSLSVAFNDLRKDGQATSQLAAELKK
jgi:hypothetical protein